MADMRAGGTVLARPRRDCICSRSAYPAMPRPLPHLLPRPGADRPPRRPVLRLAGAAAMVAAGALLSACGGGVYFSIGDGGERPQVTLVIAPTSARAGETVTLAAGAADDIGIDQVAFYRRDAGGDVLLYALGPSSRYEIQTTIPSSAAAGSTVRYFARATDVAGLRADSAIVTVQVLP